MPITAAQIMSNYLYGTDTPPENLLDEAFTLDNRDPVTVEISIDEIMIGPGRFAIGPVFTLVTKFFGGEGLSLPVGTYTKQQLGAIFGLNFFGEVLIQSQLDDGAGDYIERTFIYNSTAWQLVDSIEFVVEINASGVREMYINNFGIEPLRDPNTGEYIGLGDFDFQSDAFLADISSSYSIYRVDPSEIGRIVNFSVVGEVVPQADRYSIDDYFSELSYRSTWDIVPEASLLSGVNALYQGFFDSGITRFLDDNDRPILYGTEGNDTFRGADTPADGLVGFDSGNLVTHPFYGDFINNGVVYITGDGDDDVRGTGGNDEIHLGAGADTAKGKRGDDTIYGGAGEDTLRGNRGDDILYGDDNGMSPDDNATDTLRGGWGADQLFGEGGDDFLYGDGGRDTLFGGAGDDLLDYSSFGNRARLLIRGEFSQADIEVGTDQALNRSSDIVINIETRA